jgi:hypothetical protein
MAIINFNSISGVSTISVASSITVGNNVSIGTDRVTATTFSGNLTGNVTGTVNSSGIATFSNGLVVSAGTTAAPSISPSGDSNTGIFFPSPDTIAFTEGGVESLRLGSTGNIGIGTDNVNQKITIQNSASLNEIQFRGSEYTNVYSTTDNGFDIGINNPSSTGSFRILTANTSRFSVDSNGRITTPYQPVFHAYGVGSGTYATGNYIIFPSTYVNIGSHYNTSNGVFTAPVAGTYLFFWSNVGNNISDVYRFFIHKNNSSVNTQQLRLDSTATGSEYPVNAIQQTILTLSANDTIRIYFSSDSGNVFYPSTNSSTDNYPNFGGYLIG